FVPPVIFAAGALERAAAGLPYASGLALLGGWTAAAVALSPLAMAAACRNALD
ncbi:MAG: heme exporter protein CcmB, partial [Pseudomonadota bacterium]